MNYYIGVDGGGTKTVYALFDESKRLLAEVRGPGSNHENLEGSFDEAAGYIWDGLNELAYKAGIKLDKVKYTLMGLAGIDHPYQLELMSERLDDYGLKNYSIYNDGFIVVKAGSQTGAAIGYNMGTGMCCNAIDKEGTMCQLAGLGEFSGDIGGGHQIAKTAYRLIYDDVCLHIKETSMTKMFFDEFELKTKEDFLNTISMSEDPNRCERFIMRLLDFFFEAASKGDEAVMKEVDNLAIRGAQLIKAHTDSLVFDETVEVVLSGSIHTKLPSQAYTDLLKKHANEMTGKKLDFKNLELPPVFGCINWIFQEKV